jgi:hypothetical protein
MSIENIENKVLHQYASHYDTREEFTKINDTTVAFEISILKNLRRVFREKIIENLKSFKILNPLQVNQLFIYLLLLLLLLLLIFLIFISF